MCVQPLSRARAPESRSKERNAESQLEGSAFMVLLGVGTCSVRITVDTPPLGSTWSRLVFELEINMMQLGPTALD